MDNGYGLPIFSGDDADLDQENSNQLKKDRLGRRKWRNLASKGIGKSPRRPILLGSMDEIDIGARGIKAIWS